MFECVDVSLCGRLGISGIRLTVALVVENAALIPQKLLEKYEHFKLQQCFLLSGLLPLFLHFLPSLSSLPPFPLSWILPDLY